jgi:tetratricopeptide (TPR) repeat protein
MVLGLVREAQGQYDEAERLLREAVEVHRKTDFGSYEVELSLAEFLLRRGRTDEGDEWLAKARASLAGAHPDSPVRAFVERRAAAAAAAGSSASSKPS